MLERTPVPRSVLLMVLLVFVLIPLTACTGVLESNKPAREIYLLQPPASSPQTPAPEAPKLVLSLTTVPGLDTDNIQVLSPNARLIPVANAHWPDNLPEVMSSLSRRSLVDSGAFSAVTLNDLARPGDWQLQLELQVFYGIQDSAGATNSVRMQMEGNIRCGDQGDVFRLESVENVGTDSLAALVAAHQRALDENLQDLPGRIGQICSSD
ncbi:MAG TPA: ABC-type transport auxiliary lipoprotein family protein [Xanthomonadales bacterium]|nr:ABC-type transport auxiliary lipoprotein family protein [Xanthomonadales bacterium]